MTMEEGKSAEIEAVRREEGSRRTEREEGGVYMRGKPGERMEK